MLDALLTLLKYIGLGIIFTFVVYFFSKLQMIAWINAITQYLDKQVQTKKEEQNEQKKKK